VLARAFTRDFDKAVFLSTLALVAIGVLMTFSSGRTSEGAMPQLHVKQLVWTVVGLFGLFTAVAIPFRTFDALAYPIYILGVFLLILILALQGTPLVRERWLLLGPINFQPSEVAKFGVILVLARHLSGLKGEHFRATKLLAPALITLLPLILILKEPDLGTALVLVGILVPLLYWSGVPLRVILFLGSPLLAVLSSLHLGVFVAYLVALGLYLRFGRERNLVVLVVVVALNLVAGLARPVLWNQLKPYQRARIVSFANPDDSRGSAYQIIQSKVAIGSGGLTGKGYLNGTQKGLSFLPEQHTDFIYSVVGEEFGFVGCTLILFLFAVLLLRAIDIAATARNRFGSLLVVGVVSLLAFQVVVNIGMTLGMLPVTGIPLPLISYGGTSLSTTLFGVGLILNVGLRRRDY
jgi:rod shape determining protein RodA